MLKNNFKISFTCKECWWKVKPIYMAYTIFFLTILTLYSSRLVIIHAILYVIFLLNKGWETIVYGTNFSKTFSCE